MNQPCVGIKRQLAPNYFEVGIPDFEFQRSAAPHTAGKQRRQYWCWAACIQMILNYHGLYVTQEQLVQYVFGAQVDLLGTNEAILRALSGWAPDVRRRTSTVFASTQQIGPQSIVNDLDKRRPLLVALKDPAYPAIGHAYVLTAAYYKLI
jgi:hypothetical protein